jgi:ectoine hydroxylase-related dioxygenase (phytanoyl-CoA dioxygenase family)
MWARAALERAGRFHAVWTDRDIECDRIVIDGLGLGLEPTISQMWRAAPSIEAFECWVMEQKGGALDPAQVRRVNALILGQPYDQETSAFLAAVEAAEPVLFDADLEFWHESGYVVVHDAISADVCRFAERAVWEYLEAAPDDPESWYSSTLNGIMAQQFHHPAQEAVRQSPRIHKAFAQIWGTADLLVTTDRCGFNPPERPGWRFPGPYLHFDALLEPPVSFGTHGILYLVDTRADQGAFRCVPGFHRRVDAWLADDPRRRATPTPELEALDPTPIPGRAGDLVIWDDRLPHGSAPNRAERPRIVQYVKMAPPFASGHSGRVVE